VSPELALLLGASSWAATITANSLNDPGNGTCGGAECTLPERCPRGYGDRGPDRSARCLIAKVSGKEPVL